MTEDDTSTIDYNNYQSPYCKDCGSCGEDGCCPPTKCTLSGGGKYCEYYIKLLKATYKVHINIFPKLSDEIQDECIDNLFKLMKEKDVCDVVTEQSEPYE